MKTLVAVILALGVGFAAAYVVAKAQFKKEPPPPQLQPIVQSAAPAPATKIIMASAPSAPAEESPEDILNDLLNVKLGTGGDRNTALRLVVFKLETLAQRGPAAVPAIRSFLGRDVDVTYNAQDENQNQNNQPQADATTNQDNSSNSNNATGDNRRNRGFRGRGGFGNFGAARRARNIENLRTDWVAPPSLRLGLVGTLKEIGGSQAEQALAEMLSSTGRGVEVAYLTVILEEIAPGKYRDAAVSAAKELLMNPPAVDSPDRMDELAKSYLYGVLEFYKDTSFVPNAEQLLVGADGRLDQDAMDYLSTVLKDQAVSALYAAYQNSSLSNQFDKMNLGREIMNYVGQNSQANQLFTDTLNNADLPPQAKAFTIAQLAGGGFGPFGSTAPTDPQVISGRLHLLENIQTEPQVASDPTLSAALTQTINALSSGQPVDMRQIFGGGGRGGFGGFRGGGGNNNPNGGNNN
ncbi:MAG TPA: hypothetical protein VIK59_00615 [Verrucomicrobiae bacterium]